MGGFSHLRLEEWLQLIILIEVCLLPFVGLLLFNYLFLPLTTLYVLQLIMCNSLPKPGQPIVGCCSPLQHLCWGDSVSELLALAIVGSECGVLLQHAGLFVHAIHSHSAVVLL